MNKEKFDLQTLLGEFPKDVFLKDFWSIKPCVVNGDLNRFEALKIKGEFPTAHIIAKDYIGRVTVLHKSGLVKDLQSGQEALPFLDQGWTLYFRGLNNRFSHFDKALRSVVDDLSMPVGNFAFEVFTSKGDSGVSMHCDYDINFSVLLSGEKEWTFMPNEHILHQTNICLPGNRAQVDAQQLKYLVKSPLPEKMAESAKPVTLKPGDVIFMPRGWWHSTVSKGDCLSVNFVMKGPLFLEILLYSLQQKLVENPDWREYAYNLSSVGSKNEKEEALISTFTSLITGLINDLNNEDPGVLSRKLLKIYLDEVKK